MQTIYKRDTTGNLRFWQQEISGTRFRTIAGVVGGTPVESGWTICVGKQGRSDELQATYEVQANYKHKLAREYHETIEATAGGAHYFKPMLAEKYETFAPGYAQPKLDGVRCIVTIDGLFSREGKPILGAPHIRASLQPIFDTDPSLVLDGEIYNHVFKDDFNSIVSIVKKQTPTAEQLARSAELAQYHVYDMPSHPGIFSDRTMSIEQLFNTDRRGLAKPDCIQLVDTYQVYTAEGYDALHGGWMADGYEGSMWRADLPYEQKRSKTLRKRKEMQDAEFELVSIEEGLGNWAGVAKKITFKLADGRTCGAGIKGSRDRAAELLREDHRVVTVQFFALTPDGMPRFPVATKFHGKERTL